MAWLEVHFYSHVLGLSCAMNVILPEPAQGVGTDASGWDGERELPVLYLLHGVSDDHTIWMRRTSIERYAAGKQLAIVMPAVHRSYYSNQKCGYDYLKFIGEELPLICRRFFRISSKREDNFVAGLSMGGYGAMKVGLNYPDRYGAVASMSGILDIASVGKERGYDLVCDGERMEKLRATDRENYLKAMDFRMNFGTLEEFKDSENDLSFLLGKAVAEGVTLPKLFISMGTEDFLYQTNVSFRKELDQHRVKYDYLELPGRHEWGVWDFCIQKVLEWLPLKT
ncbi:MAG: esterase family protein [Clostridiales bacterium]|nr:esterase family protein [Clostridiales bacterium]